jgi:hypothetical protein
MSEGTFEPGAHANSQQFPRDSTAGGYGRDRRYSDAGPDQQEGIGSLISGLITDLQELVRGEIALAKTELREDAMSAGRGIGMIAAGAIVGLTGFIFLMLGVTYLLNKSLEMWLSAGIVGAALALIAALVISNGRGKLSASNLKPEQTIESLKEDRTWAKQQMNSVKK